MHPKTGFFETVLCLRSQADNNSSIKLCLCFKRDTIYRIDVGTVRFCKMPNMQQLLLSVSIGNLSIVTLLCFRSGWVKVRKTIVRKISSLWVKIPDFVATNSWKLSQHVLWKTDFSCHKVGYKITKQTLTFVGWSGSKLSCLAWQSCQPGDVYACRRDVNVIRMKLIQRRRIFQATVTIISRSELFPSRFLVGWREAAGLDPTPWRWRGWGYYVKRQNQSSG